MSGPAAPPGWLGALKSRLGATEPGSLRERVISGGMSVLAGDLYQNVLRLAANLLMTRLLYPEAFGLMLIVNLVFGALQMLSDVGIRGAVITKRDTVADSFVDTAWTIQVCRGFLIGFLALALAEPIAHFYDEPQLAALVAVASMAPFIAGFVSPQGILQEKQVKMGRVVLWKMTGPTVGVAITLVWLLIHPTIWALVAHGVVTAAVTAGSSYLYFRARRPRLRWDRQAGREIVRFGRWVFIATGLTFFARNGNSLIVSKWLSAEQLGVFSIAIGLARLVENVVSNLSWSLLFPVYAELRDGGSDRFHLQRRRIKITVFALCMPPVLLFSLFGTQLIELLYDPRYHDAGWMLQVIASGYVFFALGAAMENIPHSFGHSYVHMWLQILRGGTMLGCMLLGGTLAGLPGLIAGIAAAQAVYFPMLLAVIRRYGVRDTWLDLALAIPPVALIALGWWIMGPPV